MHEIEEDAVMGRRGVEWTVAVACVVGLGAMPVLAGEAHHAMSAGSPEFEQIKQFAVKFKQESAG